jgi:SAM-dependent methyltransferase
MSSSSDDGEGFLGRCDPELFEKEGPAAPPAPPPAPPLQERNQAAPARRRSPAEAFYDAVFKDAADAKRESRRERDERRWTRKQSFVYGEIEYASFEATLRKIRDELRPGQDVFYDLGSGAGRPVVAAAVLFPFRACRGVELLAGLSRLAREAKGLVEAAEWTLGHARPAVDFYEGDITDLKFHDWTADGDVVLVNSTCFDDDLLKAVADLAEGLRPGAVVITFTRPLPSPLFTIVDEELHQMSWGGATVFVQRRDGEDERAPFLERVGRERWGDVDG